MDMTKLKPGSTSIRCKAHPDWGTFGVSRDCGLWYELTARNGARVLSKTEAVKFWEVVEERKA